MNEIKTWAQGYFVCTPQTRGWTQQQKENADKYEKQLVRPGPTDNEICVCQDPNDAKWISSRLNLASILEQMTYDYATGKTDGSEIVALVKNNCQ